MLSPGNVPLTKEVAAFHRAQIEERACVERRAVGYQMVVDDVFSMSRPAVAAVPA